MSFYLHMYHNWKEDSGIAIDYEGELLSYIDLHRNVLRIVSIFEQQGLNKGDVVAVQLPKSILLLEIILASLAYGTPILPLNDAYTPTEAQYYLDDAQARLFVTTKEHAQSLSSGMVMLAEDIQEKKRQAQIDTVSLEEIHDESLAVLLYTSGTTGQPKGAMITHKNIRATVEGLAHAWHFSAQDRLLHMLPLFHVHGLFVAQFVALWTQSTSIWLRKFCKKSCLTHLKTKSVTVMMAVPTLYFRLLTGDDSHHFPHLRLCTSGSAPLPVSLQEDFKRRYGVRILERYGMTEAGIVLSNPYEGTRKAGTVGFHVSGAQLRIVDAQGEDCSINSIGELWISGPSVIKGYLRKPEQTAKSFVGSWLRSGDLASIDQEGYISIAGRAKDLVISGGFNIYPLEIEATFLGHPHVLRAAGVGIPDQEWGERFVMAIIPTEDCDTKELEELLRIRAKEQLAAYKRPKEYVFMKSFPCNAMGKIQKSKIRTLLLRS